MSYNSSLLVQCEDMQEKLSEVQGKSSISISDPIPFLQYLKSDANMSVLQDLVVTGQGKTKNVNLTYFQRLLESTVAAATERGCDATQKYGNCEKQYSIDTTKLLQSSELIEAKDLSRFCENNQSYLASRLAHHLDVIDRKVASQTGAEAAALLGGWSADTSQAYTITDGNLVVATKNGDGDIKIGAWEQIQSATQMSGYQGLISFGGNAMQEHMRLSLAGCCANQGLDVERIYREYGFAFAYDRRLATALGGVLDYNLVMEPGALQLIDYTETEWKEGMDFSAGYIGQQMTTPAGVAVDVYMKDDCGKLAINVFANTKLVGLPDDMFAVGDNFNTVKFVGGVKVTNP